MDLNNRQTASTYINNLLLSRGLLRNGTPIDFAKPEESKGGIDATMTQVMNLVHDLILRRDREADHLAKLSQNFQHANIITTQQTQTISRLETRNSDIDRQLALLAAQERSAQLTLRSAESRNRALREEMIRLKGSISQIRTQCATDVRRRDGEIQRMKRHLEGRRGREGAGGQVGVVVVTPGLNKVGAAQRTNGGPEVDLDSPEYSLKQETTEFLTQLSQGLSDENDALISLVRSTLSTLRSLQGLPRNDVSGGQDGSLDLDGPMNEPGNVSQPPSYDMLATSTDEVLEHLRGLLTNPSFVPLEEVEIREEEIHRLREGWEMMAVRWKEAVTLMAGWKKRVLDDGDTISLEDLKFGLRLGNGIPSAEEAHESPHRLKDTIAASTDAMQCHEDADVDVESLNDEEFDVAALDELESPAPKTETVLQGRNPNLATKQAPPPPDLWLSANVVDDAEDVDGGAESTNQTSTSENGPALTKSRIPLQTQGKTSGSTITVAQKLERAKKEADESRRKEAEKLQKKGITKRSAVTKKLKGSRRRSTLSPDELEKLMGIT